MQGKLTAPQARAKELLLFSVAAGKLKAVKRSGWISQAGITEPESVADHSFRCAILAMCIGDLSKADTAKLVRMMLLHDIQEARIGDYDLQTKKEMGNSKVKGAGRTAAKDIMSLLPTKLKDQYFSLWAEFEKETTFEAVLAHDIDKIEMLMQALEYEQDGRDSAKFVAFWTNTQNKIRTPLVRDLLKLLKKGHVKHK